jgi:intracellular sulfur oxidation DsrE/DsrF family protein
MNRSGFLTTSATLIAASTAVAPAANVPGGSHFVESLADFDADAFARIVGRPAQIRQVYESVAFKPTLLNSVKNSFNGLQFGFGYTHDAIAIALGAHGPSAAYGYSDEIWKRYRIGEFLKLTDAAGAPVSSNVFVPMQAPLDVKASPDSEKGMYQDTSIEMLQKRGLIVLTCHTAVEEQARALVKRGFAPAGMTATQVADDILTHLIPGAVVVPAMVATLAVLQATYHYTYISPTI